MLWLVQVLMWIQFESQYDIEESKRVNRPEDRDQTMTLRNCVWSVTITSWAISSIHVHDLSGLPSQRSKEKR